MKRSLILTAVTLAALSSIVVDAVRAQDGFIGEIRLFAGNYAPQGWALCDGQLLPISSNSALFSILGTTYGGDGRTTFALPDLQGRVAIGPRTGAGLTPRTEGEKGGTEYVTLDAAQMPSHRHTLQIATNQPADKADPQGASLANTGATNVYTSANPDVAMNGTVLEAGGNQPHENMPPFLAINYIICLQGNYPPRN